MSTDNKARLQEIISVDPEVMHGTPCFRGTRVPFRTLLDYLEEGHNLSEFLDDFPSVQRADAIAALEQTKDLVLSSL